MALRFLVLGFIILNFQQAVFAQKLQIGAGLAFGRSFVPDKQGEGVAYVKTGAFGLGFMIPVSYQFSERFALVSGIHIQNKTFKIRHTEFEFPNLISSGNSSFAVKSNVFQFPLLLSWRAWSNESKSVSLRAGLNYSIYKAAVFKASSNWDSNYNGNDTLDFVFSGNPSFTTQSGIELVAGLNYTSKTAEGSSYELGLTAEYATFNGPTIDYQIYLANSSTVKEYAVNERAKLLFIKLSYVYYFNFKRKKD